MVVNISCQTSLDYVINNMVTILYFRISNFFEWNIVSLFKLVVNLTKHDHSFKRLRVSPTVKICKPCSIKLSSGKPAVRGKNQLTVAISENQL